MKKGVLVIHGFTGSPIDSEPLRDHLQSCGFVVENPTLPGHGTDPYDLNKVTGKDWDRVVSEAFKRLAESSEKVYIVGVSFGGNLAFNLAKSNPVDGIVSISTPVQIKNQKLISMVLPFLRLFSDSYIKANKNKNEEIPGYKQNAYDRIPYVALKEFINYVDSNTTMANLKNIDSPALLVQSKRDPVTTAWSHQYIFDNISSKDKKMILWNEKYHLTIRGERKEGLFKLISDWINER